MTTPADTTGARLFERVRSWVAIAVLMSLVAACSGGGSNDTATTSTTPPTSAGASTTVTTTPAAPELEPLSITAAIAPAPPSMTSMALGVAAAAGIFEALNLEVEIQNVDSGVNAFRGLEAGQVDVSIVPVNVLIPAAGQGTSVRAVYGMTQRIQHQFVAPAEIQSCADLAGKTIVVDTVGGFLEGLTRSFLRTCDLTPADVNYAMLGGGAIVGAIVEGQAQGGVLPPERIADMKANFPDVEVNVLANFWEVLPNLHSHVWGVTEASLADPAKREAIVRFIAAMIRTNEFITDPANEDLVVQATSEYTGGTRPEIVREALPAYLAGELYPAVGSPGLDERQFGFTVDFAIELGNITAAQRPAYEDMIDLTAYEEAVALLESLEG